MQKIRWFLLIVAIVVALAAALQNNEPIDLQLFFFHWALPLSVILLSTAAVGFLAGALTTVLMLRRSKSAARAAKAKAAKQKSPSENNAAHPTTT